MIDRMHFNTDSPFKPALELGFVRIDLVCKDAKRCPSINLLQLLKNMLLLLYKLYLLNELVNLLQLLQILLM